MLGVNDKRLLNLLDLIRADDGTVAATMEQFSIHVDLKTRKVVPFGPATPKRLAALADVHARFPLPPGHQRRHHCGA
ncbi:hypothetical protein [Azospirillum canadense]|uniref:hypothetical protein n=1 Tax=Azospirillum canadense TaxID=403962 RepID=UPI003873A75C